ncbi:MAG: hypothetical protein LBQ49_00580 [Rickettsiales bacterium]|jgi:hypothetical protein|nr:hypothetical protein [Rickettsiales bacterium]
MRSDDDFFSFAIRFFLITALSVAVFHAMFDTDDKKLKEKSKEVVLLEQDLANATVGLAAMAQPEKLRAAAVRIFPTYKTIGTGRAITTGDLK